MQPNTISYTFDHDNDGGTTAAVSVTLTRFMEELHKSTYRTATHTEAQPDTLSFGRTLAKRSGDFLGVQRLTVKRTRARTVENASGLDSPAIQVDELNFSLPIGVTDAEKISSLMELIGFLSSSEGKAAMINALKYSEI